MWVMKDDEKVYFTVLNEKEKSIPSSLPTYKKENAQKNSS